MNFTLHVVLVAVGGFFGSICRYSLTLLLKKKSSKILPLGTLLVNLIGSFLLGWLFAGASESICYILFGVGFIGSLTTFSTIKLELLQLSMQRKHVQLLLYSLFTYLLGFLLAYCGYMLNT